MPHIPPLPPDEAPDEVKEVYEDFSRRMRFPSPPNFIMTQGHSLAVVKGSWDVVQNVLVSGKIERWIKEMLFAAISIDRNCHYCAAAHIACCRMLGVKQSFLDDLVRDVNSISVPKVRDMILFGLKCSRDPQKLSEADYEKLRQHQLGQSEILELITMSALAVYANILPMRLGWKRTLCFTAFGTQENDQGAAPSYSILLTLHKHTARFS